MCGITGVFAFNLVGKFSLINLAAATAKVSHRGPDAQGLYSDSFVGLGHRRLSIIDTSQEANQPMWDQSQRYGIVFNGEIFNYKELRTDLEKKGVPFKTQSDTEVLLHLYIQEKEKCLNKLNGFFAFCIYDKIDQTFFLARDRYGIKPLLYLWDEDKFIFASQMKSILEYGIEKKIDYLSLYSYLQLNYIPAPDTIFTNVKKLLPGHYITVANGHFEIQSYYSIPDQDSSPQISYKDACTKFAQLLEESVQQRLVSDVPLGSFLSGGVDSSIIATLAKKHKQDLQTFSIGYRDEKFFDETHYAKLVSSHIKSEHTVFTLSNDELFDHLHDHLNALDEPFGDSSSLPVYILSKQTRKHATVALSGDGADELLAGYNKHSAFLRMSNPGFKEKIVSALHPLWKLLPKSRHTTLTNKIRQFNRFAEGLNLPPDERYWRWACYASESDAENIFNPISHDNLNINAYNERKKEWVKTVKDNSINKILLTDMNFVLPNDMLTKIDMMSMAHGLEVRTPFLDYRLVNFVFSLPGEYKINAILRKRIAQDSFRDILPPQLYNRPKKGFEVPLLKWFRNELRSMIDDLLSEKFIHHQGIFDYDEIRKLKHKLFSINPEDVHARIWGLIVFQWWWKRNMEKN
ncbi:MAG: asparagine synthase (glutamine-hydrolyzing) [Flammeovirgaceae bacterium]|nr:asparagine synthase (glutamine-hydrolyzing) [Flammeovirgaceae bacterium]